MKDKFEAAIYDNIAGDFDKNGHAVAVGKDEAIDAVYTLHQQAMKEKIKEQRLNCHADLRRQFMKHEIKFTPVALKEILDSILNATEPK